MTQAEKQCCERCNIHNTCGFVGRNMEDGCSYINLFSEGYDIAIEKTTEFFYEQLNNGTMEVGNIKEFIKAYSKYMEE